MIYFGIGDKKESQYHDASHSNTVEYWYFKHDGKLKWITITVTQQKHKWLKMQNPSESIHLYAHTWWSPK